MNSWPRLAYIHIRQDKSYFAFQADIQPNCNGWSSCTSTSMKKSYPISNSAVFLSGWFTLYSNTYVIILCSFFLFRMWFCVLLLWEMISYIITCTTWLWIHFLPPYCLLEPCFSLVFQLYVDSIQFGIISKVLLYHYDVPRLKKVPGAKTMD